jgi:transcriptional regulator GlxA family with amidase domain
LRAYIVQSTELAPGWLRVLTDERLRPALEVMHTEPGKPWRLDELARASAMSPMRYRARVRDELSVGPRYANGTV